MFAVILGVILSGWVAFGILDLSNEPDPAVAGFMYDVGIVEDYEPLVWNSDQIHEKLKDYQKLRYLCRVIPGEYKIPRAHTVFNNTKGDWCSGFPEVAQDRPIDWSCMEYSYFAAHNMEGYAFGVAWTKYHSEYDPGHMLNVALVETYDGKVKIAFYEPQTCQWKMEVPEELVGIFIFPR